MNKFYFVAYELIDGKRFIKAFKSKDRLDDELVWLNDEATDIKEYSFTAKPMRIRDFLMSLL